MFKLNVKNSQLEPLTTGTLYQTTYYVDDALKDGIEYGTFCGVASGNSKCVQEGNKTKQAVLVEAGKDIKVKASGIIYDASARDRYGRSDDFENETRRYPYGYREDTALSLIKKGVLEVLEPNNFYNLRIFRSTDLDLGNGTVSSNVLTLDEDNTELKYGDKITIQDVTGWVSEVTDTKHFKVIGFNSESGNVVAKCQMDDPVYLNKKVTIKPEAKGKFEKLSDLPFTTIPAQSGELSQIIGYIESPRHIRFDLTIQIDPIVLS